MEIGSSTMLRRQLFSQGCGQTRPMEAGRGSRSLMIRTASLSLPRAMALT